MKTLNVIETLHLNGIILIRFSHSGKYIASVACD